MKFNNKKWTMMLVTGLLVLLLGSVFSVGAQGGNLSVGIEAPVNLDPALGSADSEVLFSHLIYDYLIDVAPDGSLVPNLASEWDISDDGLTYTLSLVEGATFHDGSAFSSADVVFTFNRLKELESPALGLLGSDFDVSADGDDTVVFTLTAPNADFAFGLASNQAFILQDGNTEPNVLGEGDAQFANFNGTGAFILSEFSPGESATFTANPNYWWDGQPALDSVTLVFIDDKQAQIDAVRSGTVHVVFRLPFDRLEELESEDGLDVIVKPTNQHPVIKFRADAGSIAEDVRIRQAFKLATDRELLNLDLFDGRGIVGNNDPIGPIYGPFFSAIADEVDPQASCDLLAEAGFPDGLGADSPIEFFVVDAFNYSDMAVALQEQWAEGCINVEILMRPENVYYSDDEWLTVELGVTGWGSRPTPQEYFELSYASDGIWNEAHWADEELDGLIEQARVTADIEARADIYGQISAIFSERGPVIIPFFNPLIGASASNVEGLDMHPFAGRTDLRTVSVSG